MKSWQTWAALIAVLFLLGAIPSDRVNPSSFPVQDVGGTCTKGEIRIDNGGLLYELCACVEQDEFRCVVVTLGKSD